MPEAINHLLTKVVLQNPMTSSIDAEITQGKAMVDGALDNRVKFFVYSSVDRGGEDKSYETKSNIPHFISKHDIEHHLVQQSKGKMEWTILRPCTFMDVCYCFRLAIVSEIYFGKLICGADACTRLSRQGNGHQLEDGREGQALAADIFY